MQEDFQFDSVFTFGVQRLFINLYAIP